MLESVVVLFNYMETEGRPTVQVVDLASSLISNSNTTLSPNCDCNSDP